MSSALAMLSHVLMGEGWGLETPNVYEEPKMFVMVQELQHLIQHPIDHSGLHELFI